MPCFIFAVTLKMVFRRTKTYDNIVYNYLPN